MQTFINEGHVGLLYEDGVLTRQLPPGRHVFRAPFGRPLRRVVVVDVREQSTTIKNQEILTADKVSVRLSLLVYFKLVDAKAALTRLTSHEDRIYEDVQLAARRFLATRTLDQILKDRNELSDAIKADVSASLLGYGVEILRADVKDLVFPGNLREVMNRVIETERQAEAQLIATRSKIQVAALEAQAKVELAQVEATSRAQVARLDAEARVEATAVENRSWLSSQEEKLLADQKALELLSKHPLYVRLKELETLERIGQKGNNQFFVGVDRLSTRKAD